MPPLAKAIRQKLGSKRHSKLGSCFAAVLISIPLTNCKKRDEVSKEKSIALDSGRQDGACGVSGNWSTSVSENADSLHKIIKNLSNRKECHKLVNANWKLNAIKNMAEGPNRLDYRASRFLMLPQEISALSAYMRLGSQSSTVSSLKSTARDSLVSRVVEQRSHEAEIMVESNLASSVEINDDGSVNVKREIEGMYSRLLATGSTGLNNVSDFIDTLIESNECLGGLGVTQTEILLSGAKLLGAFASADPGMASKLSEPVNKYANYIQSSYSNQLAVNSTQNHLRETISCLLDIVTYSYCNTRDANIILKQGLKSFLDEDSFQSSNSALKGLNVLVNHIPPINKWLVKITEGVAMRNRINASTDRRLISTPSDLLIYRKILDQTFEKHMYEMMSIQDNMELKTSMANLLQELSQQIKKASFPRKKSNSFLPNFLDGQGKGYKIPFILGGLREEDIPRSAIRGDIAAISGVKSVTDLVAQNQNLFPSMASFELFRSTLRRNLTLWEDESVEYGMNYFWTNFPIDFANISAQAASAGNRIAPIEALRSVRNYLLHFIELSKSQDYSFKVLAISCVDTINRLDKIIEAFDAIKDSNSTQSSKEFIKTVYQNLQMVIFGDAFLQERLLSPVMLELNAMMSEKIPGKSELNRDIVKVSDRVALMNLFEKVGLPKSEANKLKNDLASASTLSLTTLEALQRVISDPLEDMISKLYQLSRGKSWDSEAIRKDSYERSIRDVRMFRSSDSSRYQDRFSSSFFDWILIQPMAKLRRSLHPDLYPYPPAGGLRGFSDDEFGSAQTVWGFLCLQTLSLSNRERFKPVCAGSSFGVDAPNDWPEAAKGEIKMVYDEWWSSWQRKKPIRTGWDGEDAVCTSYDLSRRWKIFYMSLDQDIKFHGNE